MKIFSLSKLFVDVPWDPRQDDVERRSAWLRDPLSHPAIEQMSQRELADLPFRRTARPTLLEC